MLNIDCTENLEFLQSKYEGNFLDFFNSFLIKQECFNFCNISARNINQRFNELSNPNEVDLTSLKYQTNSKSNITEDISILCKLATRVDSSSLHYNESKAINTEGENQVKDKNTETLNENSNGSQANMEKNRAILNNLYKYNSQKN